MTVTQLDRQAPGSVQQAYLNKTIQSFLFDLSAFIRFPSVSAEPEHKDDVARCAQWLANHLKQTGLDNVRVIATKKHPLVYADWLHAPGQPILLIYGHYDVQPVDPVHEWRDHPFSGTIKNNYIFGRGASDDKGQLFAHLKALQYFFDTTSKLPINVKCIFEGEEETGSENLLAFLRENAGLLKSTVAVVSDMRILAAERPALTYSLRGMLAVELELKGQMQDLHSGNFGGAIRNPLQVLCELISKLHDHQGRISIPGFYNDIIARDFRERNYLRATGTSDQQILKDAKAVSAWGEAGYSLYERISIRPSLSVNGITGGYQGEGPKAIIPSRASAKLSFRLVPGQEPDRIFEQLKNLILAIKPDGINCKLRKVAAAKPFLSHIQDEFTQLAFLAYRQAFNRRPVFIASGGTIPIVSALEQQLGIPVILMGFALADDNLHGPNERFYIPNFMNGIKTSINFIKLLSQKKSQMNFQL